MKHRTLFEPMTFAASIMPRALREDDIHEVIQAFADATRRAIA